MLKQLQNAELTLSLNKCHFVYSAFNLLDHKISQLELSTQVSKIEIIKKLFFLKTLEQLETDLDLFDYYQHFIYEYATIVDSLQ